MTFARFKSWLLLTLLLCLAGFAVYRIIAITQADRFAIEDPERALAWKPRHPQALLVLAERQLADGHVQAARITARRLLTAEPLEGRGFRILAAVAAETGDPTQALALYEIAARRSPRDTAARAWLTEHYLVSGDYTAALAQIDAILRKTPSQGRVMLPLLVQLSVDPMFTVELVRTFRRRPLWRPALLSSMLVAEDSHAADRVFSSLQQSGELTDTEFDGWINRLVRQGRWGEAYSRWAGTLDAPKSRLTPVYNGSFAARPSNHGFDWRVTRLPGVDLEFTSGAGVSGLTAHASFHGRPVSMLNLEQPLLLAPGVYRLVARMRAADLRSERGLEWAIFCDSAAEPVGASVGVGGTFEWRVVTADFTIPPSNCDGQWLRLRNPAPSGSVQLVGGELWLDDVSIAPRIAADNISVNSRPVDSRPPNSRLVDNRVATLRIKRGRVMTSIGSEFATSSTGASLASGQRLLLIDDSSVTVDYNNQCAEAYTGPGVYVIDTHCAGVAVGAAPGWADASKIAAGIEVEKAILDHMDDRPSPPAGR